MNDPKVYDVVVIGTSAGGLFALTYLLEELPADYRLPVIVVQHRAQDFSDLLETLLQNKCDIRILQAEEKEKISKGNVYIAPPGYHLMVEADFTFSLSTADPVRFGRPSIDVLFETASLAWESSVVGVLLTGANNDGAAGMSAIKKAGGMTIAQDPEEAQFPAMPAAAIANRSVLYTWSLEQIRAFLLQLNNA